MPKPPTKRERDAMLREMDLLPPEQASKRADAILRGMLNSPPEPFTPKPKAKRRARK